MLFGQRQPGDDHVAVGGLHGGEPVGAGGEGAVHGDAVGREGQEDLVVVGGQALAGGVLGEETGAADLAVQDPGVQRARRPGPGLQGVRAGRAGLPAAGRPNSLARLGGLVQLVVELAGEEEVHGGIAEQSDRAADGHEQGHGNEDQAGAQMPGGGVAPVAARRAGGAGEGGHGYSAGFRT